jgi:P-type Cu+ transporter
VEMAEVNLLAESAVVRLRAPAAPSAGEELAARLTECGFPATTRRGGAAARAGESARKWREMAARKEELLLWSWGRVAFTWTLVALCCGSLGIHIGHGELPRDIHSVI